MIYKANKWQKQEITLKEFKPDLEKLERQLVVFRLSSTCWIYGSTYREDLVLHVTLPLQKLEAHLPTLLKVFLIIDGGNEMTHIVTLCCRQWQQVHFVS